jgi:hypothetical protein
VCELQCFRAHLTFKNENAEEGAMDSLISKLAEGKLASCCENFTSDA